MKKMSTNVTAGRAIDELLASSRSPDLRFSNFRATNLFLKSKECRSISKMEPIQL